MKFKFKILPVILSENNHSALKDSIAQKVNVKKGDVYITNLFDKIYEPDARQINIVV